MATKSEYALSAALIGTLILFIVGVACIQTVEMFNTDAPKTQAEPHELYFTTPP